MDAQRESVVSRCPVSLYWAKDEGHVAAIGIQGGSKKVSNAETTGGRILEALAIGRAILRR